MLIIAFSCETKAKFCKFFSHLLHLLIFLIFFSHFKIISMSEKEVSKSTCEAKTPEEKPYKRSTHSETPKKTPKRHLKESPGSTSSTEPTPAAWSTPSPAKKILFPSPLSSPTSPSATSVHGNFFLFTLKELIFSSTYFCESIFCTFCEHLFFILDEIQIFCQNLFCL